MLPICQDSSCRDCRRVLPRASAVGHEIDRQAALSLSLCAHLADYKLRGMPLFQPLLLPLLLPLPRREAHTLFPAARVLTSAELTGHDQKRLGGRDALPRYHRTAPLHPMLEK